MNAIKKIWEVDSCFRCPVAGYCLSLVEQRKILKNTGIKTKNMNSYELHQTIMANLHTECKISKSINKLLTKKYSKLIEKFGSLDKNEFAREWKKADTSENLIPLFFIAISNKDYSVKFLSKVYGDMHMHGFFAASNLATTKKINIIDKKEALKYKALLRREKQSTKQLTKKNRVAERIVTKLQARQKQENTKEYPLKGKKEKSFEVENIRLNALYINQNKELLRLERKKRKAEINMFTAKSSVEHLTSELNQLIAQFSQFSCAQECTENDCANSTLCSKRILIVGGMTKLESLYRNLVESNGGIFDYHSGKIRNAKNNLDARVKRADMIICPVNCNSHNACIKVKQLCRKYNKDIKMIRSSSLSAIANTFIN